MERAESGYIAHKIKYSINQQTGLFDLRLRSA